MLHGQKLTNRVLVALAFLLLVWATKAGAQVAVRLRLLPDLVSYQIHFLPAVDWPAPQHLTASAQVTLKVPTGGFEISDFQSQAGLWSQNARIDQPSEAPDFDYIVFGLSAASAAFSYQNGVEIPVFSFKNSGNCTGEVVLMDDATDLFRPPNSQQANVGQQLTTFGAGLGVNAFSSGQSVGSTNCLPPPTLFRDTFLVKIDTSGSTFCLPSPAVLQNPNGAGQGSVCQKGQSVEAVFAANGCFSVLFQPDFIGFDTLCLVHCLGGFCDTTVLIVEKVAIVSPACDLRLDTFLVKNPTCAGGDGRVEMVGSGAVDLLFCLDGNCQPSPVFDSLGAGLFELQIKKADAPDICFSATKKARLELPVGCPGGPTTWPLEARDDTSSISWARSPELFPLENDLISGFWSVRILENALFGHVGLTGANREFFYFLDIAQPCRPGVSDLFSYELCNENGCDTATVWIKMDCSTSEIFVYEGFSPNGDGQNDRLKVNGLDLFLGESELTVFDRWGLRVFSKKNYRNDWDGAFDGQPLPDGAYFYVLDLDDGRRLFGHVQLNR